MSDTKEFEKAAEAAKQAIFEDEKEKLDRITKEDVKRAALAYYLPYIMDKGISSKPEEITRQNVYNIWDKSENLKEKLPCLSNILTKTSNKKEEKKICDLEIFNSLRENALFLSEAVPYVKIYKTIIVDNAGKKEKIDISLPFDIVAGQRYGEKEQLEEKILQGGSGGSVGVANFSWNSEGKNEGNNSLYTVNFKILLQDAAQLTKIRNQVGDHKVQILDLLYYGFLNTEKQKKDGDPEIQSSIDPDYLEFRAELGFNFSNFYKDYERYFKTSLTLRVFKHNFNFDETGKVELEITAIGNIESDFSNKVKHNILENQETKLLVKAIKFFKKLQTSPNKDFIANEYDKLMKTDPLVWNIVIYYMQAFDGKFKEGLAQAANQQSGINAAASTTAAAGIGAGVYVAGTTAATSLAGGGTLATAGAGIAGLVASGGALLVIGALIAGGTALYNYLNETEEDKLNELFKISIKGLKNELKEAKVNILNHILVKFRQNLNYISLSKEEYRKLQFFMSVDEFTTLDKNIINKKLPEAPEINKVRTSGGNIVESNTNVDITDLLSGEGILGDIEIIEGDILDLKRKVEEEAKGKVFIPYYYLGDLLQGFIDEDDSLKNNLNIYLGPFSYYDYRETFERVHKKIPEDNRQNNPNQYLFQSLSKKIGSLAYVPIAVDTIVKWFKDLIESTEEQAYSFNSLLKFFMSDLIRQNISAKVSPAAPYNTISINPYYFSTEINYPESKNYKFYKNNIFFERFQEAYSMKENTSLEQTGHTSNIAFISVGETSLKEGTFKGDFQQDCENNIMHLFVNSMSSIVKNISFSRDDDALLETANLMAANDANPNKIIRQVYQANINMFGNCIFEPGNLVYIKANYPGLPLKDNVLEKIGLGGYYRVIEIGNNITPGGFSTELKCMWEMSSDGSATVLGSQQKGIRIRVIGEENGD